MHRINLPAGHEFRKLLEDFDKNVEQKSNSIATGTEEYMEDLEESIIRRMDEMRNGESSM